MSEEPKNNPGLKNAETPEVPLPHVPPDSKVVDFRSHQKVAGRLAPEKPPEAMDEDALLVNMKEAVLAVEARHGRSWHRVRELSGNVLPETEEGEKNFQELRTPRRNLNSQRARINQLRGRLQAAIRTGELTTPDDIVPWHVGTANGRRDEYHAHLALLRRDESKAIMKAYAPLLQQLEQLAEKDALGKFLDSMDERTHGIINLLRYVRQVEYDNTLFEQLFDEKKNPAFIKGFLVSEGGETKKSKPSKEKRERKAERAQREGLPGAQMHWVLEYNGARITLENGVYGRIVTRIQDPKRIITQQEKDAVIGKEFFFDLRDAPEWLRELTHEKGV